MSCFVMMPFRKKKSRGLTIDFDKVYDNMIVPAIRAAGIEPQRSDRMSRAGVVIDRMLNQIVMADVAVVDISLANANVAYELGVRHALKRSVTVLIKHRTTPQPFNFNQLDVIEYETDEDGRDPAAEALISEYIRNGRRHRHVDSPVYRLVENLNAPRLKNKIIPNRSLRFGLQSGAACKLELIGGDLRDVRDYDIWANSENTHMQMARHHDNSVSSLIRFLGARLTPAQHVEEDLIFEELVDIHNNIVGHGKTVAEGACFDTNSGRMLETHNVKRIVHVAAVKGVQGEGFRPVDIGPYACARSALAHIESVALPEEPEGGVSAMLPFFGTGHAGKPLDEVVKHMLDGAVAHLAATPGSRLGRIGFIAQNEDEFDICRSVFEEHEGVAGAD